MKTHILLLLPLLLATLTACEQLGIEDPAKEEARRDAEGRAVGAACRHAGRALEDCYSMSPRMPKSSIFAGWREMNDYMDANKIETIRPGLLDLPPASKRTKPEEKTEAEEEPTPAASPVRRRPVRPATSAPG